MATSSTQRQESPEAAPVAGSPVPHDLIGDALRSHDMIPIADVAQFLRERDADITRTVVSLDQEFPGTSDNPNAKLLWGKRASELAGQRAELDEAATALLARRMGKKPVETEAVVVEYGTEKEGEY